MRRVVPVLLALVSLAAPLAAQAPQHIPTSQGSGCSIPPTAQGPMAPQSMTLLVTQDAKTVKVESAATTQMGEQKGTTVINLDGTASKNTMTTPNGPLDLTSTGSWDGSDVRRDEQRADPGTAAADDGTLVDGRRGQDAACRSCRGRRRPELRREADVHQAVGLVWVFAVGPPCASRTRWPRRWPSSPGRARWTTSSISSASRTPGKVRAENQDHFLLCTVHPQVVVHGTSLPNIGSASAARPAPGDAAARRRRCWRNVEWWRRGPRHRRDDHAIRDVDASLLSHRRLVARRGVSRLAAHRGARGAPGRARRRRERSDGTSARHHAHARYRRVAVVVRAAGGRQPLLHLLARNPATGDARPDGRAVARRSGLLAPERVKASPFNHVLASAIGVRGVDAGGRRASTSPIAIRCALVCSDGLTKHVRDDEIAEHLSGNAVDRTGVPRPAAACARARRAR